MNAKRFALVNYLVAMLSLMSVFVFIFIESEHWYLGILSVALFGYFIKKGFDADNNWEVKQTAPQTST
jgi:hypothetical protein